MRRSAVAIALGAAVVLLVGCKKERPVTPTYTTETGVIPAAEGAAGRTIVIVAFDASKVGETIGSMRRHVILGIGSHKVANYRLGCDLGKAMAEAFARQLKGAGFQTMVVVDEAASQDPATCPAEATVLSGAITLVDVGSKAEFVRDKYAGVAEVTVALRPLGSATACYEGAYKYNHDYSKMVGNRKNVNDLANRVFTNLVDEFCKQPEFVAALQKVAAGVPKPQVPEAPPAP